MSKGSRPRPYSVSQSEYDKRWDAIFGRDLKEAEDSEAEDEAFNAIEERNKLNPPKDSVQGG